MKKDSPAPTLRGWLEHLSDDQLSGILRNRPDTVLPLPPGLGSLTARLQLRASIARAVYKLTALDLAVLEAMANKGGELHPVSAPEVVEHMLQALRHSSEQPTEAQINTALETLKSFALIFGEEEMLIDAEVMATLPNNWQLLPEAQGRALSFEEAKADVEKLSPRVRKILLTLATSGGYGLTRDAALDADPQRPIPQLIAAGLLARVDEKTVKLPAVVRRVLEGANEPAWQLLPVTHSARPGNEDAGMAAGLEVVRQIRMLIDALSHHPANTLKDGSLGVRVLGRLTKELQFNDGELARLISIGVSAGLFRRGVPDPLPAEDDGGNYIAPTPLADEWLGAGLSEQLAVLMRGWWSSKFASWTVGATDEKEKLVHLLSPTTIQEHLPDTRAMVMASLSRVSVPELPSDFFFHHPLIARRTAASLIENLVAEAEWIGAYANGCTAGARALLNGADLESLSAALHTPEPVDYFIVQGDFTIMVPGPLAPGMQQLMSQIATLESPGLASVYRLSEASFRHALDVGLSTTDIESFLKQYSATELPQSVGYLLQDIARKHGTLRGGPALSYMRSDDPALLLSAVDAALEVAPEFGLRQIAPTVAIAQVPLVQVIATLRKLGFQPVAEDSLGARLNIAAPPARVPNADIATPKAPLEESRVQAAIRAIRREEVASGGKVSDQPTLSVLQAAVRGNRTVTLGFVDKQGVAVHRVVKPLTVSAGQVDAVDESTGSVHRFMLHRITEVIVE